MKITPTTKLFLAGNPAELEISVAAVSGEANRKAVIFLRIHDLTFGSGYSASAGAFRLIWRGGQFYQIFKFSTNPDNSGTMFLPQSSFYNYSEREYYAAILEKLKQNKELMKDYFIESYIGYNDFYIKFTAYNPGADYNITYSTEIYGHDTTVTGGSAQISVYGVIKNVPAARYVDFSIQVNKDSFQVRKNMIALEGRNDLFASINLAPYAKDISMAKHFTFPEPAAKIVKHNVLKEVRVLNNTTAFFNDTLSSIFNKVFLALPAQLSEMQESMLVAEGKDFIQHIDTPNGRRFLTNAPNPKSTDIYAPEKLYWLVPSTGDYKIYVKKYFKCIEKLSISDPIALSENEFIEVPASYRVISADEMFRIYKYDIWLKKTAGTQQSETFTFVIDRRYMPYARYFLFKNRYAGFDVLRTTGKVIKNNEVSKTLVKLDREARVRTQKSFLQLDAEEETTYDIETGLDDVQYSEWLAEFGVSPDVFVIKGQKTFPVTSEKMKLQNDEGEFLQSNKISISHLQFDDYTPDFVNAEPILPDFGDDWNKDFNTYSWQDPGDFQLIADAGADKTTATGTVKLAAAALSQPEMTGKWTKLTGPGTAIFTDDTDPETEVSLSPEGNYILRWTVTYGRCKEYDDMVVVVSAIEEIPVVVTGDVLLSGTQATLYGTVSGSNTERGFVYAIGADPDINSTKVVKDSGSGSFSHILSDIPENTNYRVRAYCITPLGTYYGAVKNFTRVVNAITNYPAIQNLSASNFNEIFNTIGSNVTVVDSYGYSYANDQTIIHLVKDSYIQIFHGSLADPTSGFSTKEIYQPGTYEIEVYTWQLANRCNIYHTIMLSNVQLVYSEIYPGSEITEIVKKTVTIEDPGVFSITVNNAHSFLVTGFKITKLS